MMMKIGGILLLERVINRVSQAKNVTKIVVATSDKNDDNPIASFCKERNIECIKGELNDVAKRFLKVALLKNANSFVRINGDSPLIDPEIIDLAINYYYLSDCDIVTNVFPRTFPKGQSVEIIRTKTFEKMVDSGLNLDQKEHVTKKYYDSPENYRMVSFTSGKNYNNINMCIDNDSDRLRMENAIKKIGKKEFNWRDLSNYFLKK
jgi:spore coat polysaccharide biosynthesis protein SpsF (cytidylyltransferase family)